MAREGKRPYVLQADLSGACCLHGTGRFSGGPSRLIAPQHRSTPHRRSTSNQQPGLTRLSIYNRSIHLSIHSLTHSLFYIVEHCIVKHFAEEAIDTHLRTHSHTYIYTYIHTHIHTHKAVLFRTYTLDTQSQPLTTAHADLNIREIITTELTVASTNEYTH